MNLEEIIQEILKVQAEKFGGGNIELSSYIDKSSNKTIYV